MLRASLHARSGLRQLSSTPLRHNARTLASTVLFTKTWENEPVSELKKEAKSRGLSTKGNKSVLVTRLRDHEQALAGPPAPRDAPSYARSASTTTQSSTPPSNDVPPAVHAKLYLDVKIPDLSAPPPEPPIAIPFVPDFWESSRVKHEAAPNLAPPTEPGLPKIVVVAGTSTHAAGGPTYSLSSADEFTSPSSSSHSPSSSDSASSNGNGGKKPTGLWADIVDDLGLPTTFTVPRLGRVLGDAEKALADSLPDESTVGVGKKQGASYEERRLDPEEKRGVWVLLGLLGGSWVLGGILSRPAAFVESAEGAEEVHGKAEH